MYNKNIFDTNAMRYDRHRQKIIPNFDIFYKTLVDLLPFKQETPFSFLDLGAGTGLLTELILNVFPNARATLIDISEQMLSIAKQRFKNRPNIDFIIMNYSENSLSGMYNAVVSAMSIHHLSHEEKAELIKKIHTILKPQGVFINADLARGTSDTLERKYQSHWKNYIDKADLSPGELDLIHRRMQWDLPASLDFQLECMKNAGFTDVDCFYKYFNFVVYYGKKSIE